MPSKTRISVTLEHPTDWDLLKVSAFLRQQIISTDSELQSLEMEQVEECHICGKQKGQPPVRCNGHYEIPEELTIYKEDASGPGLKTLQYGAGSHLD